MRTERHPKIVIEFNAPDAALEWFDDVKKAGHLPAGVELFHADALDISGGCDPETYIVRDVDERPRDASLRHELSRKKRTRARKRGVLEGSGEHDGDDQ